jgi:hypothetical protein
VHYLGDESSNEHSKGKEVEGGRGLKGTLVRKYG